MAVTSGFTALLSLSVGIWILVNWKDMNGCNVFFMRTIEYYDHDPYHDDYCDDDVFVHNFSDDDNDFWDDDDDYYRSRDYCMEGRWGGIAILDGVLWSVVTGFVLYFVYSGRHYEWQKKYAKNRTDDDVCVVPDTNDNNANLVGIAAHATEVVMGEVAHAVPLAKPKKKKKSKKPKPPRSEKTDDAV